MGNFSGLVKRIKVARNIISVEDPLLIDILSSNYGRKIRSIKRINRKKSFICRAWKVEFISHKSAFMKIDFDVDSKNLLLQEKVFQSKIFKANEVVLPLWPTKDNHPMLSLKCPRKPFNLTLSDYLENTINFKKKYFSDLAVILAKLHSKKRNNLVLSHGDFTRENILLDENKNIWLVDWENSKFGYPECDISYFVRDGMDAYGLEINNPLHKSFLKTYEKYSKLKVDCNRLEKYLKDFNKK